MKRDTKWYSSLGISDSQWPYYRFWLWAIFLVEALILILNQYLFEIYIAIALLFFGGFTLRIMHLYPGQEEPLTLDLSAVIIAICYAVLGRFLILSPWRFLLILCSSVIIIPHFIYISLEK